MAFTLTHGDKNAAFLALWNIIKLARSMSLCFAYASMDAILDGIQDAMAGPETFANDPAFLAKATSARGEEAGRTVQRG